MQIQLRKDEVDIFNFMYQSFKTYFDYVSQDELHQFHKLNQAFIRRSSYGSDSMKLIIEDFQKALKEQGFVTKYQDERSYHLLSFV